MMWLEEGMGERDATTDSQAMDSQAMPATTCAENGDEAASGQRATADSTGDETCCPICFDPIIAGEAQLVTTCGHAFHFPCIRRWLPKGLCPVCRNNGWLGEDEDEEFSDFRYDEEIQDILDFLPLAEQGGFHFLSPLPSPVPDMMTRHTFSMGLQPNQLLPPPPPPPARNDQRPHRFAAPPNPPRLPPWGPLSSQGDASARNQGYGRRPPQWRPMFPLPGEDASVRNQWYARPPPPQVDEEDGPMPEVQSFPQRFDMRGLPPNRHDNSQWPADDRVGMQSFNAPADPPWPHRAFPMPCPPHRGAQDSWTTGGGDALNGPVRFGWQPYQGQQASWPAQWASCPDNSSASFAASPPRDAAQAEQYSGFRPFQQSAPPPVHLGHSHDRHDGTRMGRMQQHEL
mmetsp:Transcript_14393/g.26500  ORF Transcript_14393/g.26500 Transcript_14393/m.26500 type:complete len:400 (-) Transcript_14393:208-1407(-)